ncbi:hypothetical protein BVG98_07455 [Lacticaseibacillus rhamnosus]|nr:hypothetical protein BVG98_07455 [Lacticaseibacillus rhamnosus]
MLIAIDVNIVWSIFQVVLYRLLGIDINTLIFVEKLHLVQTGSSSRAGQLVASGLHWHPGNLAPQLVIAYLFANSVWKKLVIVVVAVLTFNSTCLVGMGCCIGFDLVQYLYRLISGKIRFRITKKILAELIFGLIMLFASIFLLFQANMFDLFNQVIANFYQKVTFSGTDNSSMIHFRYYQSLPEILKSIPFGRILFGYGYGCSGYIYTHFLGQYSQLTTWAVESDVINNLFGTGLICSILMYAWIFRTGFSGKRRDVRYAVLILIFIIQGFFYNIQFDWIILLLCMLRSSTILKWNFFTKKKS